MTVHNHLLFSEIFFQKIRGETADLDNLRATLATIRGTWQYYLPPPDDADGPTWQPASPLPLDDVARLRANVVEPIFAYLELTYDPCAADGRAFFLYADWDRQDRTGLCLVLPYSADIEGCDPETGIIPKGRNYAQQLIRLLRQHDLDWGVLTNGRHWRLFHRSELSPTETYLHVDLERVIAADDVANYIVFHRFFSRPAFARQDGRQRLDLYKQQSDEATEVIEDHLSAHVEEIIRQLCQGLVESCRAAGEDATDPAIRSAIYKNALFLVYRLLFVLYAEARALLPLDAPTYRAVCLRDLLTEVRDNHRHGLHYDDDHAMWSRLQALFALIDQGDPAAGVPAYNGGLFDPGRRPFLSEHHIRNDHLQAALIRLSTVPARGKTYDQDREPQPIDYRDLSVRHLGSLYEGLLEYSLFVVEDEPRLVRVSGKQTRYVPYSQAGKVRATETLLPMGDVYFSETEGERKATGSYYTPEDVVDYIVRHTVGEKLKVLKAEFYETQQIERQLADLADTPADVPAHRQIRQALDEQFLRFVQEKVLGLKILDPAMGSGHFLVNATHAVADFIVELLNETPWENRQIDTDVATWKRRVAERCIFGVDLNELAVELAKLCLWMTTAATGKPLTFLDHHLRWGNSLVGAWLEDVGVYPLAKKEGEQAFTLPLGYFQVRLDQVLAGYRELYARSGDDVEEVRQKARLFDEEIYPALKPYRELLDLHTGVYFGNGLDAGTYAELGTAVADPARWARLKAEGLADLLAQHAGRRWFHWELEFPEVFAGEGPGSDVVIGNPPYGVNLGLSERQYFRHTSRFGRGRVDSYIFFLERGHQLLRIAGLLSMIVPNAWLSSHYGYSLRGFLLNNAQIESLLDCSDVNVFMTATVATVVSTMAKVRAKDGHQVVILKFRPDGQVSFSHSVPQSRWQEDKQHLFSISQQTGTTALVKRMGAVSLKLDRLCRISQGIIVYETKQDSRGDPYISTEQLSEEWVPFIDSASCVDRYAVHWNGQYLKWGPWLCRPRERDFFENPKILFHRLRKTLPVQLVGAYEDQGRFNKSALNNIILRGENSNYCLLYILALFNSKLINFWFVETYGRLIEVNVFKVSSIPVRCIVFATPGTELVRLAKLGITEATGWIEGTESDSVEPAAFRSFNDSGIGRWLEARLTAQPEQADAVHDLLAHLAREMTELQRQKQTEVKRFLAWIKSELLTDGVGVNDLNGKTFLQSYSEQPMEKLVEVLTNNRRWLRTSPEAAAAQLHPAYEESLEVLGPLLRRIARTDRLIDFIVYRLYGLTGEEVAVVEENRS